MRITRQLCAACLIVALVVPCSAIAQTPDDVWRSFAEKLELGTELQVRLQHGKSFRATLVAVEDTGLLLQPKTRVVVPIRSVPYDEIASLERAKDGGVSVGKATAIGFGTGIASFWGMMFLLLAMWND
jgi:hypothetical protein